MRNICATTLSFWNLSRRMFDQKAYTCFRPQDRLGHSGERKSNHPKTASIRSSSRGRCWGSFSVLIYIYTEIWTVFQLLQQMRIRPTFYCHLGQHVRLRNATRPSSANLREKCLLGVTSEGPSAIVKRTILDKQD